MTVNDKQRISTTIFVKYIKGLYRKNIEKIDYTSVFSRAQETIKHCIRSGANY